MMNVLMQIGKPFVVAKLKDYPQFQSVALAIEKSGFKVRTNASFNHHIHAKTECRYACCSGLLHFSPSAC